MRDRINEMRQFLNLVDVPAVGGDAVGARTNNVDEGKVDIKKADFSEYGPQHVKLRDALVSAGAKGKFDESKNTFDVSLNGIDVEFEAGDENIFIKFKSNGLRTKGAPEDKLVNSLKGFLKFIHNYG